LSISVDLGRNGDSHDCIDAMAALMAVLLIGVTAA
jgi:hypothetical protein